MFKECLNLFCNKLNSDSSFGLIKRIRSVASANIGYGSPNITFACYKCSKDITFTPPVCIIFVKGLNFNYKHIKYVDKIGILLVKMVNKGSNVIKFTLQKKGLC